MTPLISYHTIDLDGCYSVAVLSGDQGGGR